jgi:hypothetical protein
MSEEKATTGVSPDKPVDPAAISEASVKFLDRAKIELELRLSFRKEYEQLFQIWKDNELTELRAKQDEIIADGLKKYLLKVQEEQKPPEPEDIQKLLDQEYETFTIPVDVVSAGTDEEGDIVRKVTYTIRELPQSIEKKFYRQFKTKLVGKLQMLESFTQAGMDKPFEEKAKSFLELFDESFDMLAEAVVLCLNPFGRKKDIDMAWVQNNISSDRQWRIIEAQMKVNRLRDFFSKVSTSGRDMMTMRRPDFQALQQLVA